MTPDKMISKYIQLRNKIEVIKQQQKDQLAPYLDLSNKLETALLDYLNQNNLQHATGDAGTAYRSVVTSVKVQDWPATLEYIKTNEAWELLEARVAKTGATTIIEETGKPIPGVSVSQAVVVRVRTS